MDSRRSSKQHGAKGSSSRSSRTSSHSLRTVSEVMEELEVRELSRGEMSRLEAAKSIREMDVISEKVRRIALQDLDSPLVYLAPLCPDPRPLMKVMKGRGMVVGGVQATSMFYPISKVNSHPWDMFYDSRIAASADVASEVSAATGAELLERYQKGEWSLSVLRKSVNGYDCPITVRVYGAPRPGVASVLNERLSCQHSFIAHYGAVCIWPQLNDKRRVRDFEPSDNSPQFHSKSAIFESVSNMTLVQPKSSSDTIRIKTTSDSSVEVITFSVPGISPSPAECEELTRSHVFAVSRTSIKYVGDTIGV